MKEDRILFFRNLAERFRTEVVDGRLYLIPRLSLDDVASRLGVSRYNLSYAVNEYLGVSFCRFLNERRIAEVVRLIEAPGGDKLMIRNLAELAGFSDRKTFMRICKEITGLSPSDLKAQLKKGNLCKRSDLPEKSEAMTYIPAETDNQTVIQ